MRLHCSSVVALLMAAASSVAPAATSLSGGRTDGLRAVGNGSGAVRTLVLAAETVPLVCSGLMLLIWGGALLAYGLRRLFLVFSLASCVSALATLMLGATKPEVECGVAAMLPVLGVVCMYFFLEYNIPRNGFAADMCGGTPEGVACGSAGLGPQAFGPTFLPCGGPRRLSWWSWRFPFSTWYGFAWPMQQWGGSGRARARGQALPSRWSACWEWCLWG